MRRTGFSLMLVCVLGASLKVQAASQPAPRNTNAPAASVAPTVIARTPSSRTWARIISQTNAAGQVSTVTNKAYTELASGLCYEKDGELADSVEQIDIVADGAGATQAQHKVHFAGNANTAGGAVIMNSRDGKTFATRVYGLSYWDAAIGTNVLLAPLRDCQGTLVGSNRVVYTNAFKGLNADIEYVFTKGGLEQNVILREPLPTPDSLGLAAASTRFQVLTEFFSPPAPHKTKTQVINGISEDTLIDFGAMGIGMGNAFTIPGEDGKKAVKLGRVSKHWKQLEGGRVFLFEDLPYEAISNALQDLPVHASAAPVGTAVKHLAALEPLLPRAVTSAATPMAMQLAKSMPERPGVLLDYMEVNYADMTGNLQFQSDTTYFINGSLVLATTPNFEGGTVLKFASSVSGTTIQNYGDSLCGLNQTAYCPVIFTSSDDNSVGDTIFYSSGKPSPGQTEYLRDCGGGGGATGVTIANVRFSFAGTAYEDDNDQSHIFEDCQFVQCGGDAICLLNDVNLYLGNDLFTGCGSVLEAGPIALDAENITADSINTFFNCDFGPASGGITNSILTACDSSIYNFTIDSTCVVASSGAGIYQTAGDGDYYLVNGSTNRAAGTANINPSLLADLQTKTTYPPVVFESTSILYGGSLGIAAWRDSGTPGPDIGYHYPPLDYVFGGATVNGNLFFSSGVAVAWYNDGSGYGILLGNTMNANFQGTASAPVWWVRANTVQESGGNTVWAGAGAAGGLVGQNETGDITQSAQVNLLFTHCSILAGGECGPLNHFADDGGYLILNAMHSEFYGGNLGGYALSGYFMNCLMDRVVGGQYQGFAGNAWIMTNCTWHGGSLTLGLTNTDTPLAIVRDSAFDGTAISLANNAANPSYANYDFNAFPDYNYGNATATFPIGGASNVYAYPGFNWQSSVLGNYYLPSDSQLIAAGDVTADQIGLSDFTTQTNQAPEGDSIVDIGYHYQVVAQPVYTCIFTPGGQLAIDSQFFCVGELFTNSAAWTDAPGVMSVTTYDNNGNLTITTNAVYSTIVTNWSVVDWNGGEMISYGSGVSSGYSFTATNAGVGTNVFYYTYANPAPCGGSYTISISNTFFVVGVASLAPANTGTVIEISNNTPGTRTFLVQANPSNCQNTLAVYATPTPANAATNLPACWSLNGVLADTMNIVIASPAVYEVDCVCGTSALTDFFVVTTNAVTTNEAAINNALDAPCGTGPLQLGYWSFDSVNLDYWAGQSNALDSVGSNNGTIYGTLTYPIVTYTNLTITSGYSSNAFSFNGAASYISFGTNAGNFGTNNFMIDFWMKTTASWAQGILGKRPVCDVASMWDVRMQDDGCITFEACQNNSGTLYASFASHGTVNDGLLHHITISRANTSLSLYIDGTNDTTISSGIANIQNSTELMAGKSACREGFDGLLGEIKLWTANPWSSSRGWPPIACYNVQNPVTPWTNGMQVDCTTNAAELAYNYLEADGSANLNGSDGALAFWFSPDWNGGTGPGRTGYLFEFGDVTAPGGGWALLTDPAGTELSFVSGSNGVLTTNLSAPIGSWLSNQWHQIALSYSAAETLLFMDGGQAASGAGLNFEPDLATRLSDGFTIGSDPCGSNQATGVFDELTTYNCPVDFGSITSNFDGSVDWSTTTNGLPDWWEMEYFGNLNQPANGFYDGGTLDNGEAYSNGIDPNIISFTISCTNQYVNLTNAPLLLGIQGGVPYNWAVTLDNTNFGAAGWTPYTSSNITASLGTAPGWHTVWVGLRGLPANAQQTWNAVCLNLDLSAPTLVVTNATNLTIPMLQLQGYANEELSSLTFDLANANGTMSNQTGFMTGATFDTNSWSCTNVAFKCFDLVLASGANTVTLHAADLAGNVANASFNFNLNYSNKPAPGIQLYWPQDGTQISGNSFTLRGALDDPTVMLYAEITNTNGDDNVVAGLVERNGNFWVENIPLFPGANYLSLTAIDINANVTTTNFTIVQSGVQLTISPTCDNLYQPTAGFWGTISDTNYVIWVNGVSFSNFWWDDYFMAYVWTANNVPVNGAGRAVVQARAIPNTPSDNYGNGNGNGGGGASSSLSNPGNPTAPDAVDVEIFQDKAAEIFCLYFHDNYTSSWQYVDPSNSNAITSTEVWVNTTDWSSQTGGTSQSTDCSIPVPIDAGGEYYRIFQWQWDTNGNGIYQQAYTSNGCGAVTNLSAPEYYAGPLNFPGLQGFNVSPVPINLPLNTNGIGVVTQQAASAFGFNPGGLSLLGVQNPICVAANAVTFVPPIYQDAYQDAWLNNGLTNVPTDPKQVNLLDQNEGADGMVWSSLPAGEGIYMPIRVKGPAMVDAGLTATNFPPPKIYFNGTNVAGSNLTVMVGQQITLVNTLGIVAPGAASFSWSVPGPTESQFLVSQDMMQTNGGPIPLTVTDSNIVSFFWVLDGTYAVTCTNKFPGMTNTMTTTFHVFRPTNISVATKPGSVTIDTNDGGSLYMFFGWTNFETGGMSFSNSFAMPTGFSNYSTEWLQLVMSKTAIITNTHSNVVVPHVLQYIGPVLDTHCPYDVTVPQTNRVWDTPSIPLYFYTETGVTNSANYQMWLMFQPTTPPSPTNWVPLFTVNWQCSGTAIGSGLDPTNWHLSGTNISVLSRGDSGTNYPAWTNNSKNFGFVPP